MNTHSILLEDLGKSALNTQIQFRFVRNYTQKKNNFYLESHWDVFFVLPSGHVNRKSEALNVSRTMRD